MAAAGRSSRAGHRVTEATLLGGPVERLQTLRDERTAANQQFFDATSERLARLCHRMAERFARGGRLIAVGLSPAARSDVRHVAVEFVHPVIVGKRALPALGLAGESGALVRELELTVEPDDIVIAFGEPSEGSQLRDGVAAARAHGCLTIAFSELGAEFVLEPPSSNEIVRQ